MKILNLDKIIPEPKQIILGGKTFIFEKIPSKYTLKFASLKDDDTIDKIADILQEMFEKFTEETITSEWIIENASIEDLTSIMRYLLNSEEGNEEIKKNEVSI